MENFNQEDFMNFVRKNLENDDPKAEYASVGEDDVFSGDAEEDEENDEEEAGHEESQEEDQDNSDAEGSGSEEEEEDVSDSDSDIEEKIRALNQID